jgi:hypothetical protein
LAAHKEMRMTVNRKRRRRPKSIMLTLSLIGITLAIMTTSSQPAQAGMAPKSAASVLVLPAQATLKPGEQALFTALALDADGKAATGKIRFTWSVTASAGQIVTTNDNTALVRAGAQAGRYANAVVARLDTNIAGNATINIAAANTLSIEITPPVSTATVGDARLFTATVTGGASSITSVAWQVAPALGTLQSSGPFTALVQMGSTPTSSIFPEVITATATGAMLGTASVALNAGPPARVVVSPASATLDINATQTFTAAVFDRFGNLLNLGVTWLTIDKVTSLDSFTGNSAVLRTGTKAGVFADGLRAVQSGAEAVVAITIPAGPPVGLTLSASPGTIKTDGQDSSAITVQVVDAFGNATGAGAQINVSVESCAGACDLSPSAGTADAQGRFAAMLRSTNTSPTQSLASQITLKGVLQVGATTASATTAVAGSFTPAKSFLALLHRDFPVNNHTSCTALRVSPPAGVIQPPNQRFNLYRFTATSASYVVTISDFTSAGQLLLYRINADRCAAGGTVSVTFLKSAPLASGNTLAALDNLFVAGTEYLVAVQTTGALSDAPYRIDIRP